MNNVLNFILQAYDDFVNFGIVANIIPSNFNHVSTHVPM